jgi:CheY-like chemotaxis protein
MRMESVPNNYAILTGTHATPIDKQRMETLLGPEFIVKICSFDLIKLNEAHNSYRADCIIVFQKVENTTNDVFLKLRELALNYASLFFISDEYDREVERLVYESGCAEYFYFQIEKEFFKKRIAMLAEIERQATRPIRPPVKAKILIIEDDEVDLELIQRDLGLQFGFDFATDYTEAQIKLDSQKYQAIVIDINLPSSNGYEILSRLHESRYNKNTPTLFSSGNNAWFEIIEGLNRGAKDYVRKPLNTARLKAKLNRVLSLYKS